MAIYGSCFEPAVVDLAMKREPAARGISPYGDWDTLFKTLNDRLGAGPYILGERFSAADVLWGAALSWMTLFKLVPETPEIQAYLARVNARPAVADTHSRDAKWLEE
jgi:glutathione S-transferase